MEAILTNKAAKTPTWNTGTNWNWSHKEKRDILECSWCTAFLCGSEKCVDFELNMAL